MRTNTDCTVYRADGKGYKPVGTYRAMWQDSKGYVIAGRGLSGAYESGTDTLNLFMPIDADIKIKDIVVRGRFSNTYESTSEITADHDCRVVTAVNRCDYGSANMHHLEVTAR